MKIRTRIFKCLCYPEKDIKSFGKFKTYINGFIISDCINAEPPDEITISIIKGNNYYVFNDNRFQSNHSCVKCEGKLTKNCIIHKLDNKKITYLGNLIKNGEITEIEDIPFAIL